MIDRLIVPGATIDVATPIGRVAPDTVQLQDPDRVGDGLRARVAAGVRALSPVHWPTLSAGEETQLQLGRQDSDGSASAGRLSPLAADFTPGVREADDSASGGTEPEMADVMAGRDPGAYSPESEGEWHHLIECDELGLAAQEYIDANAQRDEVGMAPSEAVLVSAEDAVSTPSTVSLPSPTPMSPWF